ncbi:MAG: VCBS repeat-containing protein, partial [Ignavibacteria bacterium]|nr:VCBS repeat-containing protein [Ignavibacteria bacterium]
MKKLIINAISVWILFTSAGANSQTLLPGFPKIIDTLDGSSGGAASPIIADFDRAGFNELLCGVCNELNTGKVLLISHNGVIKPGWPKIIRNLFNYINTAAGDLNRDGYIDIIVRAKDSVYVFDYSGNNFPGFPVYFGNGNVYYHEDPLGLYDMNNDGYPEIIAYCDNRVGIFDRFG